MKKLLSLLLAVLLLTATATVLFSCGSDDPDASKNFAGGTGSEDDPYLISNAAQLKLLAEKVNNSETHSEYADKHYKLVSDIDLALETWTPIGGPATEYGFKGTFDGNGHTVSNLKITQASEPETNHSYGGIGLFGSATGTIRNLSLSGLKIEINGKNLLRHYGGIVGILWDGCVENCTVNGEINAVTDEALSIGGAIGQANGEPTVKNCTVDLTMNVENRMEDCDRENNALVCGGLVGSSGATVTDCFVKAEITVTAKGCGISAGILAGDAGGSIQDSLASGSIRATNLAFNPNREHLATHVGGFIGYASYTNVRLERCSSTGDVYVAGYGNIYAGGFCGSMDGTVINCFTRGTVDLNGEGLFSHYNTNGAYVGGMVGLSCQKLELINSFAARNVTAKYAHTNLYVGGLLGGGLYDFSFNLENCLSASTVKATNTVDPDEVFNFSTVLKVGALSGEPLDNNSIHGFYVTNDYSVSATINSEEFTDFSNRNILLLASGADMFSEDFYENTLHWDLSVWEPPQLYTARDNYPTLRRGNKN